MTADQAREIIAAGETLSVEFKGEETRPVNDGELVEAVVCLANRPHGEMGWLFIGVEDDGRITGARPRHEAGRTDPLRLQALVANRTRPSLAVRVSEVDLDGSEVLALEVPASGTPIGTSDGKYIRRALAGDGKPACIPFAYHEMLAQQADRGRLDYSALDLPGVLWDDLDPLEFDRFRRSIRESRGRADDSLLPLSDRELAKALGAIEANHEVKVIRVLGLLLFGREEVIRDRLPPHEVAFQVLAGVTVEVNDFG